MFESRLARRAFLALCLSAYALVAGAQEKPAASTQYQPEVGQAGKDVVWVPTPQALVDKMLDMGKVTSRDFVMDLGSGDGRTVITAAKRGARALGIEYNPDMVELSKKNAAAAGVNGKATFVKADIFESDYSKATVLTLFLLPQLNLKLRPTILDMKPGTRVVSNSFHMEEWEADETVRVVGRLVRRLDQREVNPLARHLHQQFRREDIPPLYGHEFNPGNWNTGHVTLDGRIVLRETAQTPDEDGAALADLSRHRYCSTNNLWFDLAAVKQALDVRGGILGLPLIRNVKPVDPADPSSPQVIQIETAMGSAIEVFEGARTIEVGRDRFVPVKTTNDLLVLRSDVYQIGDDFVLDQDGSQIPFIDLDPEHFRLVGEFDKRFPEGAPSLREASKFTVEGDWTFGRDVRVVGDEIQVRATPRDKGEQAGR